MIRVMIPAMKMPVIVGPTMKESGWFGGQWVSFTGKRTVELANNTLPAGFMLIGYRLKDFDGKQYDYKDLDAGSSNYVPYQYDNTAIDAYGQGVMITDTGCYDFNSNAYDTTQAYAYNQTVYVNNNAVLTSVNTGYPVGIVHSTPQDNNNWLGVLIIAPNV